MARTSGVVFLTAVLLASCAAFASAQDLNLLGQLASLQSTDTTIDDSQAQYEGTGLVFNKDGTVGVVVKGVPLLTVPGLNLNSDTGLTPMGAPAPMAPTPASSKAVDLQVAATDLPAVISSLTSLNFGRKLKL